MEEVQRQLREALSYLDSLEKLEWYQVASALEPIAKVAKSAGVTNSELRFELTAAYLTLYEEPCAWGTYFGPELSSFTGDGQRIDSPPLESISPQCIAYWSSRMAIAKHPALRARYADLVWDLNQIITGTRPPIAAAHIAIDNYVEAILTGRCETFDGSGDIQRRALALATSVDADRLRNAVPKLQEHAASASEIEERDRLQLDLFELLQGIRGNRRPADELKALAAALQLRLNDFDASHADKFIIQDFALPLASYYWSSQQRESAKAVIRIYGRATERLAEVTSSSMLASGWLQELYELYQQYEMHQEARDLISKIESKSKGIEEELAHISQSISIPQEELDNVIFDLTSGTKEMVLQKLAFNFLLRVNQTENLVKELAVNSTFMLFTQKIVAEDGRFTASIGPVDEDLDGHVVQQMTQSMQFYGQIYRPTLEAAITRLNLTPDDVLAWLAECPLFLKERLTFLKTAIIAYFNNDWVTAIHIAIPQIENALRQLLVFCGQPLTRPHRNGTFMLKNLDEVLRDPTTEKSLPNDVRVYLRVLLCDQRGLNVRNNVCHGLWDSEDFNLFIADRVIHALLVIGLLRPSSSPEIAIPSQPTDND